MNINNIKLKYLVHCYNYLIQDNFLHLEEGDKSLDKKIEDIKLKYKTKSTKEIKIKDHSEYIANILILINFNYENIHNIEESIMYKKMLNCINESKYKVIIKNIQNIKSIRELLEIKNILCFSNTTLQSIHFNDVDMVSFSIKSSGVTKVLNQKELNSVNIISADYTLKARFKNIINNQYNYPTIKVLYSSQDILEAKKENINLYQKYKLHNFEILKKLM